MPKIVALKTEIFALTECCESIQQSIGESIGELIKLLRDWRSQSLLTTVHPTVIRSYAVSFQTRFC
jgi:hypothetical protein